MIYEQFKGCLTCRKGGYPSRYWGCQQCEPPDYHRWQPIHSVRRMAATLLFGGIIIAAVIVLLLAGCRHTPPPVVPHSERYPYPTNVMIDPVTQEAVHVVPQ